MLGTRPLKDHETKALIAQMKSPRDRALLLVGLATGLRISELLQLKKLDFKREGKFTPRVYINKERMKGGKKHRVVYLDPRATNAVKRLLKKRRPGQWLFTGKGRDRLQRNRAHVILKAAANAAGINAERVSCHSLRKTFATNAYYTFNENLSLVQAVIGHEDIRTTLKYVEPCGEKELWERLHLTQQTEQKKPIDRSKKKPKI